MREMLLQLWKQKRFLLVEALLVLLVAETDTLNSTMNMTMYLVMAIMPVFVMILVLKLLFNTFREVER